jgi:hypothetical protein
VHAHAECARIVSVPHAFIVRPFGEQSGIDFDQVEKQLIDPVLTDLKITGRTTAEIFEAGNIRTDMFELLLVADVVIADISIHNANVYYELGIRHALRDRVTVMIRARMDKVPFDLSTDRYLAYDATDPAASHDSLRKTIRNSLAETNRDSPVFNLLPLLQPTDPEEFRPVPEGFTQEVRAAAGIGDLPKLAVLADEAHEAQWQLAGLRVVGDAQFELGSWPDAKATFEAIRKLRPKDTDANLKLGTVLQRLGDLSGSTAALELVLKRADLSKRDKAEAWALIGRNAKARWRQEWIDKPEDERHAAALSSAWLEKSRVAYDKGFSADQNHWYPGINALALLAIRLELARLKAEVWKADFETAKEAREALADLRAQSEILAPALRRSLQASRQEEPEYQSWRDLTEADLTFLTTAKPSVAAAGYRRARAEDVAKFHAESAADQLQIYFDLGVFTDKAEAALAELNVPKPVSKAGQPRTRVLVFSGHRIDAPDRPSPRFPPAAEGKATGMIRKAVEAEQELAEGGPMLGIAGGASGGDLIFHEQCADLGIATELLLALPHDQFCAASVADAGDGWVERFRRLWKRVTAMVLAESEQLPNWLATRDDYSLWQRNNRWILHTATSRVDTDVTLIVLWDGKGGDGPGGTEDMVGLGKRRGVKVVVLDANELRED